MTTTAPGDQQADRTAPLSSVPTWRTALGERAHHLSAYLVFLILVGAAIPWRSDTYFTGAIDPVVVTKAALNVVALILAYAVTVDRSRRPLVIYPWVFLSLYLVCTLLGAYAAGNLIASGILAVRVVMLAVAISLLARHFDGYALLQAAVGALATFALVGGVTGLADSGERLAGGMPPLHPNELAKMCAIVVIWQLVKVTHGRDAWLDLAIIALGAAAVVATGSRTALGVLGLTAVVTVLYTTRVRWRTVGIALMALPLGVWVIGGTDALSSLLERDDGSDITTLSNRTIAWQSALAPKDSAWLEWLGGGLSVKQVEVSGQWWTRQILDSSWVSALVQGGILGLALCAAWMLYALARAATAPGHLRGLQLALLLYLTVSGLLESGLFDSSTAFIIFFTALMATAVPRATASVDRAAEPPSG